jgi:hypothetical protein
MKRGIIIVLATGFAIFGVVGSGSASTSAGGTFKDGPYSATTPDSGCSGNNWAQDLFVRNFVVTLPAVGGIFTVKEKFQKGRFLTNDGNSPGNPCTNSPTAHIKAGVSGKFSGFFGISVTNGVFDPNGSCVLTQYDGWQQCDTAGWVAGFFGNGASYTIDTFKFNYSASGQNLIYNAWQNADATNGGNTGDIASS